MSYKDDHIALNISIKKTDKELLDYEAWLKELTRNDLVLLKLGFATMASLKDKRSYKIKRGEKGKNDGRKVEVRGIEK